MPSKIQIDIREIISECRELIEHLTLIETSNDRLGNNEVLSRRKRSYRKACELAERLVAQFEPVGRGSFHLLDCNELTRERLKLIVQAVRYYWTFEFETRRSFSTLKKPHVIATHPYKLFWLTKQVTALDEIVQESFHPHPIATTQNKEKAKATASYHGNRLLKIGGIEYTLPANRMTEFTEALLTAGGRATTNELSKDVSNPSQACKKLLEWEGGILSPYLKSPGKHAKNEGFSTTIKDRRKN